MTTTGKIYTRRGLLILAILLTIATKRVGGADQGGKDVEIILPRYEVTDDGRDPFFPPRRPDEVVVPADVVPTTSPARITGAQLVKTLNLTGLVGNDAQRSMAIVNGRLYKIGDEILVDFQGLTFKLKVTGLTITPPSIVVKYGDNEYNVALEVAEDKGENQ